MVLVLVTVMTIVQDLPRVAGSKSSQKAADLEGLALNFITFQK